MGQSEHSQIKPGLILLALAIVAAQILWLSQQFDTQPLTLRENAEGWRALFGQLGNIAKLFVVIAFTSALILHTRFVSIWISLRRQMSVRRFVIALPLQLGAFALLLLISEKIFRDPKLVAGLSQWYFASWLLVCLLTFFTWLSLFASVAWLRTFLSAQKNALAVSVAVGTLIWAVALYTRELWGPMSEFTFILAALLLYTVHREQLYVDATDKLLGVGDFIVNIAPACSGYEGVGLVTAFTAIYLWLYRQNLRFPRVFLLFPLAAAAIWLLNIVRIVVLILIGHHWSAEVAVGGFHSQAGWLTFIMTSLAILWLAGDSAFFSRKVKLPAAATEASKAADNAPAEQITALIIPLVVLLAASLLTSSLSAGFDWLYPLRVAAVGLSIGMLWRQLQLLPYRMHPVAPLAGLLVAVLWVLMLGQDESYNSEFRQALDAAPSWLAGAWLLLRLIGTAVTVPIAEELAFRAYLLCKLSGVEPSARAKVPFAIVAVAASSLAFGALHGAWVAGTVAGVVYALVRIRTQHIGDAILAHGITNALLFAYAATTGAWHLL